MLSDENKLSLELYKELGLEVRQRNLETYATNRLMLPPLVIGLLVLYGEVEKFLGVEFKNPESMHWLVWFGCVVISLIWICNVSRLAQLSHWHLETQRQCERKLGLIGHRKIHERDEKSNVPTILRHNRLRLGSFGAYSFLLLVKLKSMNFHGMLTFLYSIEMGIWIIIIVVSVGLPFLIWSLFFCEHLRSSRATPTERWNTKKEKFRDTKKWNSRISIKKWRFYLLIIICLGLFAFLFFSLADLPEQLDVNDCLVRGLKYFAKGNYEFAIEDFNIAIALDSNNAGAYFNRGSAYYKTGEFAYAIVDFDMAIALDPQNRHARDLRNEAQGELESLRKQ